MLIVGSQPFKKAKCGDPGFDIIMNGGLKQLLKAWGVNHVDDDLLQIFEGIFKYQDERMSVEEIKKSAWFKQDEFDKTVNNDKK